MSYFAGTPSLKRLCLDRVNGHLLAGTMFGRRLVNLIATVGFDTGHTTTPRCIRLTQLLERVRGTGEGCGGGG